MPIPILSRQQRIANIILRMAGRSVSLTDLTTISVTRILLEEALVTELQQIVRDIARSQDQWFISSATGEDLDRRLADYGFVRSSGSRASGVIVLTSVGAGGSGTTTFNAGVKVRTNPTDGSEPKRYTMDPNPANSSGQWASVTVGQEIPITAVEVGPNGNTPSQTITTIDGAQVVCNNILAITNGQGRATDADAREEFRLWLASRTRGTRDAILYWVTNFAPAGSRLVRSAALIEWNGDDLMEGYAAKLYIDGGSGQASGELVGAVQLLVDGDDTEGSGLRAAGAPILVVSASPSAVDIHVQVQIDARTTAGAIQAQVEEAIRTYLSGLPVAWVDRRGVAYGQVSQARLSRSITDIAAVLTVKFYSPTGDIGISSGSKAIPGTITVDVESLA